VGRGRSLRLIDGWRAANVRRSFKYGENGKSVAAAYIGGMAKLTRTNSVSALVDAEPTFGAGTGRFSIGLTSRETGASYHLHLSEAEARRFADFVNERV
jgi:hypothetical protein